VWHLKITDPRHVELDDDQAWSDDELEEPGQALTSDDADLPSALKHIRQLERRLAAATHELSEVRAFVASRLDSGLLSGGAEPAPRARDDDTHYFDSYGENDIHQVMLQDRVRTTTYAAFLLQNPHLLRDKVVLDVGCGTGILSLFAARAGARRVYAVDAAPVAERAARIVRKNDFDDVITVVRGKIEEVELEEQADVIVSEWMGYALLYESMLDSVLVARDRFLKPGGLLAPGQARMCVALADGAELWKERVGFWSDVYGRLCSGCMLVVYADAFIQALIWGRWRRACTKMRLSMLSREKVFSPIPW
jgi:protein arginine N-methyltransferase 3